MKVTPNETRIEMLAQAVIVIAGKFTWRVSGMPTNDGEPIVFARVVTVVATGGGSRGGSPPPPSP